jgi:signal transduction histidine kinase
VHELGNRAEAVLAGERRLLEMIAGGCTLPVVLHALCSLVDENLDERCCSILLVDPHAARFRFGAGPGLPAPYNDALHGRPLSEIAGPCGKAALTGAQVIVPDIESATEWDAGGWRELALRHELRSCWSTPILSLAGKVLGTFAIYGREPGGPTALYQALVGQFTHIASIAIERAQTEDALNRNGAFLAEAQRLSRTGSFSWQVDGDQIVWSDETYRIYELDPGSPVTFEQVGRRLHPDEVAWFGEVVLRARNAGEDLNFEHRLRMPDGRIKFLHVVAHATRHEDGTLEYVGAVQDVTEQRQSEAALSNVRSELARIARVTTLGALTASIAHEVNQPLAGIVTNASTSLRMLGDTPPDLDGARDAARRTIRDANRAAEVVARLRALFGSTQSSTDWFDLNDATREVLSLVAAELHRARAAVRMDLAPDLPRIQGDRVQLQQVVLNLVLNAAEAMATVEDRPRHIFIRTELEGSDRVRLSVKDTGPGLAPATASRLFDMFYTTKAAGMGIGLSISRSIVEAHAGRLWAVAHDGPGATFTFAVPVHGLAGRHRVPGSVTDRT